MSTIEYMALSKPKRALYSIGNFFKNIPHGILTLLRKIPRGLINFCKKIVSPFTNLFRWFADGNTLTKLSFIFMGAGQTFRKQKIKGILTFIYEIFAIVYMIVNGIPQFIKLPSFGYIASSQYTIDIPPFSGTVFKDDSFLILLNCIVSVIVILVFCFLYYTSIREAYELEKLGKIGKEFTDADTIRTLTGKNYHNVLLSVPTLGIACFTVIPMIFMILIGFTNYNSNHMNPKELFDWVGMANFNKLLGLSGTSDSSQFAGVFLQILLWTLIWSFFATFTNYFLGMIVAIMINKKGIKLKKIWRTILITTIAVPQFVSLLLISKMFNDDQGIINHMLLNMGLITENIKFFADGLIAKVVIIVVNMWIGIPYTMLMCTGILMNIPEDLYESARIDGASPFKMYMKITLPYMLFVTTPYLISTFVGNINNFNVIYLLTQGGPTFTNINGVMITTQLFGAGQTDLLITWLYKMAMGEVFKDYGVASVVGILVFVVIAFFSLIFYSKSKSVQNEEEFQ